MKTFRMSDCKSLNTKELTEKEIRCLYSLTLSAVKAKLPGYYYFGNYSKDRVCINKENGVWEVYDAEQGKSYCEASYAKCSDACMDVISRIADTKKGEEMAERDFLKFIKLNFASEELKEFVRCCEFNKTCFTKTQREDYARYRKKLKELVQGIE